MVSRAGGALPVVEAERLLAGPAASLPPIVLAAGPEDFLRDRIVAAFRAGADRERADFRRIEGDEADGQDLAREFAAMSLFGTSRRIWIREGSKLDRSCEEAILGWADGPGEGVRLLVTTSRGAEDLKILGALASRGVTVSCIAGPAEARRWAENLCTEAGLKLGADAAGALAAGAGSLLALRQEIEKLRLHADAAGRVAAAAVPDAGVARAPASPEGWARALLAGDRARRLTETALLDAEGSSGSTSLWAVAERALGALDPQPYGPYRRTGAPGPAMTPAVARRALHAVYRADLALKRGEIRDAELREFVGRAIEEAGDV
jgi:DNA polymerase III delta subunit